MNDDNFLERLAASLNQNASVKNVFGEPIRAGDKVIIPVAQVMLGMGGGHGHSVQQGKKRLPTDPSQTVSSEKLETPAEGAGGGGGMRVVAKGVYEVTPRTTRFIPAHDVKQLLIVLAAGFLLGRLFAPKHTA
ncbi:MAG: hypothetical protein H7Z72_06840 [Bacteroidetes bacterium]|nr:hypothetical protein [Fibrella sp.]